MRTRVSKSEIPSSKNWPGKNRAALAVLDLDDPEIGIALDLAGDIGVGGLLIDESLAGCPDPSAFSVFSAGLSEYGETEIEAIELDQDGAGVLVAPPRHRNRHGAKRA